MILLDIMMPRLDGFETLARLKASEVWRHVPVVVISATSDLASVIKGIELGADDYLPKPFDPVLLQARLNAGLEKKRLHDLEQAYTRSLERELEIGKEIQAGFLPETIPAPEGWEIVAHFRAAREVAGDFYDVFELPDGKIAMMVGDVTDKGVGSALYMALYRTLLRAAATQDNPGLVDRVSSEADGDGQTRTRTKVSPDPEALGPPEGAAATPVQGTGMSGAARRLKTAVAGTNRYICRVHAAPQFVTLFFAVLDPADGQLIYISAGHDPPFHLRNGRVFEKVMPTGPAIGLFEEADFQTGALVLEDEDLLFMYTDGVTDVQNEDGERFGPDQLQAVLEGGVLAPGLLLDRVTASLAGFCQQAPQFDDVTVLAVGRRSAALGSGS